METCQWAVKVTTEHLDTEGAVTDTTSEIWLGVATSEEQAHARHAALVSMMASYVDHHPKRRRFTGAEIVRRPVGEWETVS